MFDKIKFLMGFEDVEDDMIDDEPIKPAGKETAKKTDNFQPVYSPYKDSGKVVNMQPAGSKSASHLKLMLIEPKGFEECPKLVDNLKSKKPLIINLEKIDRETARKIFDFLSGATYALDGNVQRVASNIFVFAPENVDVAASQDSKRNFDGNNPWG